MTPAKNSRSSGHHTCRRRPTSAAPGAAVAAAGAAATAGAAGGDCAESEGENPSSVAAGRVAFGTPTDDGATGIGSDDSRGGATAARDAPTAPAGTRTHTAAAACVSAPLVAQALSSRAAPRGAKASMPTGSLFLGFPRRRREGAAARRRRAPRAQLRACGAHWGAPQRCSAAAALCRRRPRRPRRVLRHRTPSSASARKSCALTDAATKRHGVCQALQPLLDKSGAAGRAAPGHGALTDGHAAAVGLALRAARGGALARHSARGGGQRLGR